MAVLAAEVRRLTVTVGTEENQILQPIVVRVTVYVMQGHAKRLATPLVQAALLAALLL